MRRPKGTTVKNPFIAAVLEAAVAIAGTNPFDRYAFRCPRPASARVRPAPMSSRSSRSSRSCRTASSGGSTAASTCRTRDAWSVAGGRTPPRGHLARLRHQSRTALLIMAAHATFGPSKAKVFLNCTAAYAAGGLERASAPTPRRAPAAHDLLELAMTSYRDGAGTLVQTVDGPMPVAKAMQHERFRSGDMFDAASVTRDYIKSIVENSRSPVCPTPSSSRCASTSRRGAQRASSAPPT